MMLSRVPEPRVEQQRALFTHDQVGIVLLVIARLANRRGRGIDRLYGPVVIDHMTGGKIGLRRIDNLVRGERARQLRDRVRGEVQHETGDDDERSARESKKCVAASSHANRLNHTFWSEAIPWLFPLLTSDF